MSLCSLFLFIAFFSSDVWASIKYPHVRRDDSVIETYHGIPVKDPYRWLEYPDAKEVNQFIEDQNNLTAEYVDQPIRDEILTTLTNSYNYARYSALEKAGSRYFYYHNSGIQNQDVLYVQDSLDSEPRVFLDPNKLSEDGTVAVVDATFSDNGELVAYEISSKGSDWVTIRVRNVSTGQDFPETLVQVKFSEIEWTLDNAGFFYASFPRDAAATKNASTPDGTETDKVSNHKIYYHRVGTMQSEDVLIAEFPEHPNWLLGHFDVTEDGLYLLVYPTAGSSENQVYYASLTEPLRAGMKSKLDLIPVIQDFSSSYSAVANDDSIVYFYTNRNADNYRIIGIDLNRPGEQYWSTVVPEDPHRVLNEANVLNKDKLVLAYLDDVKSKLELRFLRNGSFIQDFPLEIGSVNSLKGKRKDDEFFFKFVSFLTPGKAFRVDLSKQGKSGYEAKVLKEVVAPGVDESKFAVKQVFYPSKDGTKVPMFMIHRKDYVPQRSSPTFIYGYGGFNINLLPSFRPERLVFVQHFDGVYCVPNIRGGGEYGKRWHDGGRLLNKQKSFDDFQAAAEYMIAQNYTVPSRIVINGGSNGGYLVGASVNQRPELYGGAIAQVGVLDLLRYHKFTIGSAWVPEYGSAEDGNKTHFENLYRLSPLHNVRLPSNESVQYPAVLLLTGDHDDRVVPLHSYKFAAELQHTIGSSSKQTNPLLLKVTISVGHGAGKPTSVKIAEYADMYTFLVKAMGFQFTP